MAENMFLKFRSVGITEEDFKRNLPKAVKWENLGLEHYIACRRYPGAGPRGLWAHDGIVKNIDSEKIQIFNPGRRELSDFFPDEYGVDWFLVKPEDYTGPRE
jgi:hypothetical protein